jgi:hypothetical protein
MEVLLEAQSERLTQKAVDMALEGDGVALRLCLDRLYPPRKDRPIAFDMPKIGSVKESSELTASLLASVAEGGITPSEATEVASLIEKHARIREISDFEARLKALEERFGHGEIR